MSWGWRGGELINISRLTLLVVFPFALYCAPATASPGDFLFRIDSPNPANGDAFGRSLEVVGDRVVIGAPAKTDLFHRSGFAYIFDDQGNLVSEVPAPDRQSGAEFGEAVTGLGDRIFISSARYDDFRSDSGRIYEFDRDGNLQDTIEFQAANKAGRRLAATSDTLVVGTAGGVVDGFLFFMDPDTYEIKNFIQGMERDENDRRINTGFGLAFATKGDNVIVNAPSSRSKDDDPIKEPKVRSFSVPSGEMNLEIVSSTPYPQVAFESFGTFSVGTAEGRILIPIQGRDGSKHRIAIFDDQTGELIVEAINPWPHEERRLGFEVEGYGEDVLTSAFFEVSDIDNVETVPLFDGTTGELLFEFENPDTPGFFGEQIAVMGDKVLISSPSAVVDGIASGAVYVFEGVPEPNAAALAVLGGLFLLSVSRRIAP